MNERTKTPTQKQVQRVLLIEGGINLMLLLTKLAVGVTTNSLAILADAVHSLSDLANNIIAWIVVRISHRPPDSNHPYGHKKFEILAVFGLATLLSVVAFELILSAFRRGDSSAVFSSGWTLGTMVFVLCANFATASWQRRQARRLNSAIIEADAQHTFSDVLTTVGVIIGWQLSAMGYPVLDAAATGVVALMIFYMSYALFRRALPALVDEVALAPEEVRTSVLALDGVQSVSKVRSRWIGDAIALDLVITVDAQLTIQAAHEIADRVESELERGFDVEDATVHVEPALADEAEIRDFH
jgi:cation diffusion facilitator family transporter